MRKIAGRSGRAAILWLLFHVTGKGGWIGKEKLYWLSFYDKIELYSQVMHETLRKECGYGKILE